MTAGIDFASPMYESLGDQNLSGQYIRKNQEAALKEDTTLWDYGSAAYQGLNHGFRLSLPEQYVRFFRTVGRITGSDSLKEWTTGKLDEYDNLRREDPYWQPDERWMNDYTTRSIYEGFNSIATSLGTAVPGLALAPVVPAGIASTAIGASFFGAAFGGGIISGFAEYDSFMDNAVKELSVLNPELSREDIENEQFWNAALSGFAEGGFEFAGDYLGGKLIGLFGKAGAEPARNVISKLFRNAGKSMLAEVPSELATAYAQDWLKESGNLSYEGRLQAMFNAFGPAVVSAGAYGAAGTLGKHFMPNTELRTKSDEVASKLQEASLRSRWGDAGYQFLQDNILNKESGIDQQTAFALSELVHKQAQKWAKHNGQDVSSWYTDKGNQFSSLQDSGWSNMLSLAQAMITPESSFGGVIGNTLQPLLSSLDQGQIEAITGTYGNDQQSLVADFMSWVKDPAQAGLDSAVKEAFTIARDELLDGYGALQTSGHVKISPEAQSMFNQLFEQTDRQAVEAPSMISIVDDQALTAELQQVSENSPGDNERMVDAFLKHTKYNFNPFTVGEDVRAVFAAFDKALAPHMDNMLRRQSDADMDARAQKSMQEEGYTEQGINSLFRDVVDNKEGSLSFRMRKAQIYHTMAMKQMKNLSAEYFLNPSPQAAVTFLAAREIYSGIHKEMRGIRSEAGRFLRSVRKAGEDNNLDMRRINELVDDYGGMDFVNKLATLVNNAQDNQQLKQTIDSTLGAKTVDMLVEHVTLGMLTNPATHVVNFMGNATTLVNEVWNRFLGSYMNPDSADGLIRGEHGAMISGFFTGWKNIKQAWSRHREGYDNTGSAVWNVDKMNWDAQGSSIIDDGGMMERKLTKDNVKDVLGIFKPADHVPGLSQAHALATGGLSAFVDFYGRGLGAISKGLLASDMAFKTIAYHMEMNALAYRRATHEAQATGGDFQSLYQKYTEKGLKEDKHAAMEFAKKVTFQSDLGSIGKNINKIRTQAPLTRLMIPFLKTPVNIIKYGAAHTPLVSKMFKEIRMELDSGNLATQQLAEARVMSGTMIWAGALYLASQGLLTGQGPVDPEERKKLQASGWQSNSLRIPLGDTVHYIGIDRLDPGAFILNTAASFYEISQHLEGEDSEKASMAALGAAIRTVSERSYMQSVQSILDLVMNIDKPEGKRALRDLVTNAAIPASAVMRTTARVIDPIARETDTVFNQLYASIPGFSSSVPERRNFLGEVINAPEALGPDHLVPFRYSQEDKTDTLHQEIVRLGGIPGVALPGNAQRTWRHNGKSHRLDAKLFSKYMGYAGTQHKIKGQTMVQRLDQLVNSASYGRFSDDKKAQMIRDTVSEYRKQAQQQMIRTDPGVRYLLGLDR